MNNKTLQRLYTKKYINQVTGHHKEIIEKRKNNKLNIFSQKTSIKDKLKRIIG